MKTVLRLFLLIALLLAALATVALVGALQWFSTQDTVRLIIDGQPVHLHIGQDIGWVPLTAGIALAMLLVFLIVPLVVLLALGFSAAAGVLSLAAALSPLLLMGALAWWIFRRNPTPTLPTPPASPSPAQPRPWAAISGSRLRPWQHCDPDQGLTPCPRPSPTPPRAP